MIPQEILSNIDNLIYCKKNKCRECKEDLLELRKRIIEWDGSKFRVQKPGSTAGSGEARAGLKNAANVRDELTKFVESEWFNGDIRRSDIADKLYQNRGALLEILSIEVAG